MGFVKSSICRYHLRTVAPRLGIWVSAEERNVLIIYVRNCVSYCQDLRERQQTNKKAEIVAIFLVKV